MKNRRPASGARRPLSGIGITLLAVSTVLVFSGLAHASRVAPPVPPPQQSGTEVAFMCETTVDPPRSVVAAWEEFYACIDPEISAWFGGHPETVAALEQLYDRWTEGRTHDLRDRAEAGQWSRRHSVDFASREVELSSRQVSDLAPIMQGAPVRIPGELQRLFVDRASERLFLTTSTEGLVSISVAHRYAFELEGRVGSAGATDFFIIDQDTAVMEETVLEGGNRDLVVLDISDRTQPREITRLRGVIPTVNSANATYNAGMRSQPPTFDQYRLLREGRMSTSTCGQPPTVSTHPGISCRPDGSCYRRERMSEPNGGICERIPPAQGRVAIGRIRTTADGDWQAREPTPQPTSRPAPPRSAPARQASAPQVNTGRAGSGSLGAARGAPAMAMPSPAMDHGMAMEDSAPSGGVGERRARSAREAGPAPDGGAGGAGSLSQMMVFGNTLYVLSADHGRNEGWLTTFDMTRPQRPVLAHVIALDNGPEALQRHDNLLLIAGRDALMTASLGISTAPRLLGEYRQACPVTFDPVVVEGSIAYRTIIVDQRNNACRSRLEVIELSQPHQPVLRSTRAIARPRGLAVLGERLFVADESQGVHVFDLTDPVNPSAAGILPLRGVKDLVLSGFDLYAMTGDQIETYWVGPLFERGVRAQAALQRVEAFTTVERGDEVRIFAAGWVGR